MSSPLIHLLFISSIGERNARTPAEKVQRNLRRRFKTRHPHIDLNEFTNYRNLIRRICNVTQLIQNTTADKQIIVQSLCRTIKKIIERKLKKDLRLCLALGCCAFHIIHKQKKCQKTSHQLKRNLRNRFKTHHTQIDNYTQNSRK